MANNCFYTMKATYKDETALKRLISIMEYKDPEYFIYRCFSVSGDITKEEDYYVANLTGDVAWSCSNWFGTEEKPDDLIVLKFDLNTVIVFLIVSIN